jgi:DNA-binding response OmpR family regulator
MPADDRVLLLDMGAAERGRLAALINQLGYVAILAEDVAAAQAIWEREALPIMIVDLRDQLAQIAELRAQMPGSAIIVIGARALAAAVAAWQAGADGYLPRPVRRNELANALEHVLRTRAARAAELAEAQLERSALAEFRRMAAELARQINAPLIPILGMADLLAEELPPDHPGHAYAQAITDAALRIRDIAWMLVDIAQQQG